MNFILFYYLFSIFLIFFIYKQMSFKRFFDSNFKYVAHYKIKSPFNIRNKNCRAIF